MPLQRQIVDIPVGAGVDEITGSMSPTPGKFTVVTNAHIVDMKTLEQRPGFASMSTNVLGGGSVAAARRLLRMNDELLIDDGNGLYTYVRDDDTWRAVDLVSETSIDKRIPGERGAATIGCKFDATWCSGMFVHAWTGPLPGTLTQNCYARITDELTGARLPVVQWLCQTGSNVRVLTPPGTTKVFVFYAALAGDGTRNLYCRWVDIDSPSVWSAAILVTQMQASAPWDACPINSTRIAIIYDLPGSGHVSEIDLAGAIQEDAATTHHPVYMASISYNDPGNALTIVYAAASPNGLRAASYPRSPLMAMTYDSQVDADIYSGAGVVELITASHTNVVGVGLRAVYTVGFGVSNRATVLRNATVSAAGVVTAGDPTYHIVSMGVPKFIGTRLYSVGYIANATEVGIHPNYLVAGAGTRAAFLLEVPTTGQCRAVCRIAWMQAAYNAICSPGLNLCTTGYVTPIGILSDSPATAVWEEGQEGFDLYTLDWTPAPAPLGAEQDGELIMSGGVPNVYCGDRVSEYGFNMNPRIAYEKAQAGGIPPGTYGYAVCYVHRDARGVTTRSAPVYTSVTLVAPDDEVHIHVTECTLTTRMDALDANYPVQIELYRTLLNGSVYYHHSTADVIKSTHTHTFVDINVPGDAVLPERRTLYTGGDVLENVAPPAFRHVITHNNRLWGISCDDVDRIWLSKFQSLRDAQGFNEVLTYRVSGADLVALASIDSKLIAFGKRGVWYIVGSGPSDTNQSVGTDLGDPIPISTEHGCIDARSVCVFPGGVTFQSTDGLLYVLGSDMQVRPISLPVYDTLHTYPIINSVCYIPDEHELRVVCTKSAIATSTVLVYNTLLDQWYNWAPKTVAGLANPPAVSGIMAPWSGEPDRFALLLTSGVVLREYGTADPDGSYPTVTVRTGPLAVGSVQAYQRVWSVGILFEKLITASYSAVTLSAYNNHLTASAAWTASWSAADTQNAQTAPRLQLDAHVPMGSQKCEAIALQVSWVPVGGKNMRLQGLSLLLGMKAGKPRILPAAARK